MSGNLLIGVATATVTPPLLTPLDGEFRERRAEAIFSELRARALVLDDCDEPVALISVDVCRMDPAVRDRILDRVGRVSRIRSDRVFFACTHTHGGPALSRQPWYRPDASYLDVFIRRVGDAVALADRRRVAARLRSCEGRARRLAFNRRFWMRDGTVRTNPGALNPHIVRPAGPVDETVGVVRAVNMQGRTIAVLVNYSLHAAVVTNGISADFPEAMERELQRRLGREVIVLFLPGCSADVNHVDVSRPEPVLRPEAAERIGRSLGTAVAAAMRGDQSIATGRKLEVQSARLRLTLRRIGDDEAAGVSDGVPAIVGSPDEIASRVTDQRGLRVVRGYRRWLIRAHGHASTEVEVQLLRWGELAVVTLPGEMFVELGLRIKSCSPYRSTLVSTLNGSAGYYLATNRTHAEGGYEVESSPVAAASGDQVAEVASAMLRARDS